MKERYFNMSLDVTLYKKLDKDIEKLSNNDKSDIYLAYSSHLSCMFETDKSTFKEYFKENKNRIVELYSSNITHNLTAMAEKVGIYKALWRPYRLTDSYNEDNFKDNYDAEYEYEQSQIIHAKDVSSIIEEGLKKLKDKPEYYKQFDSENGWGLYIHFVPFVEKYLKALKEYPNAIINVDR